MFTKYDRHGSASVPLVAAALILSCAQAQDWKPSADWGHWRLGHRPDIGFLEHNKLTVTFGSGAPNFELVDREQFNAEMEKAKASNRSFHDKGYIVLRYLSSSLNGESDTGESAPRKDQLRLLKFYRERWKDFEDYLGPRPAEDPTAWITVRPDGTFPFYRYAPYGRKTGRGFETWGCPNNPDFVRMMEGRVRAQAETGIDGSYVDWTQIAGETCYCRFCRAGFLTYLEKHLPREAAGIKYGVSGYEGVRPPVRRGDPFWMEWITFRGYSVAEFHKRLRASARRHNPHFMIAGNVYGGFGYGPIACDAAGHMEMLGRDGYDDFLYSEIQEFLDSAPRKNEQGVKITNSPALKFLTAAARGKPVIVYATEITPPIFPNPTEKCLSAMAQINIAEAAANHTVFREKRETPPGATAIYRFLAANEDRLATAQMDSNVAVVASLNQYLAGELSFAFSASRVLADRGLAHVMIVEDDLLAGGLNRHELIVVPYLPLLSPEKQKSLVEYVEGGGRLLVLGRSGIKSAHNVPQQEVPLALLFGKAGYPEQATRRKAGRGSAQFIPLSIPSHRYLIPMKSKGEYTTFGPTMADVFADIPEGYTRNRIDPGLRRILDSVADGILEMLPGRVTRLAEASPFVEITSMLTADGRRMLLHLVNYDVTLDGDVTPARRIKLNVALPPKKAAQAVSFSGTLSEMKSCEFKKLAGGRAISFELDEVRTYGLVEIRLE
jgi:hypothetical protein